MQKHIDAQVLEINSTTKKTAPGPRRIRFRIIVGRLSKRLGF